VAKSEAVKTEKTKTEQTKTTKTSQAKVEMAKPANTKAAPAKADKGKADTTRSSKSSKGFFRRWIDGIRKYFSEVIGELKKVRWPTRREATTLTIIVLLVTLFMSIILGGLDFVFSQILDLIIT
jgi:preprotein translocase subunit SecE